MLRLSSHIAVLAATGAVAAPAALARPAADPVPASADKGATAVSSQSLVPGPHRSTPSPGASGGGATAVSSQSLIRGARRAGALPDSGVQPVIVTAPATRTDSFDWGDAGIGAGGVAALLAAGLAVVLVPMRRRGRHTSHTTSRLAS